MRSVLLIITLLLGQITILHAQFGKANREDVESLKKSTVYVVLSDSNEAFNKHIKKGMETHWDLSKYEFISFEQLKKEYKDENKFFILVSGLTVDTKPVISDLEWGLNYAFYTNPSKIRTTGQRTVYGTTVLTIQQGGKKFNQHYNEWLVFCYGGINAAGFSSAKTEQYVKLIQNTLQLVESKDLKKLKWSEANKQYNSGENLSKKTLVLWEKDIPTVTHTNKVDKKFLNKSEIEKRFSGKYVIVKDDKLEEFENKANSEYLYLGTFVEGTFNVIYLYDSSGKIYYYDQLGKMVGDSTFWFNYVLKNLDKAFKA